MDPDKPLSVFTFETREEARLLLHDAIGNKLTGISLTLLTPNSVRDLALGYGDIHNAIIELVGALALIAYRLDYLKYKHDAQQVRKLQKRACSGDLSNEAGVIAFSAACEGVTLYTTP